MQRREVNFNLTKELNMYRLEWNLRSHWVWGGEPNHKNQHSLLLENADTKKKEHPIIQMQTHKRTYLTSNVIQETTLHHDKVAVERKRLSPTLTLE